MIRRPRHRHRPQPPPQGAHRAAAWLLGSLLVLFCGVVPPGCRGQAEQELPGLDPVEVGRRTHKRFGCNGCHSLDGTPLMGPTYLGLWGREVRLTDGRSVRCDSAYIRRAILDPQLEIVEGYPPRMISYRGQLSEAQIQGIIALIRSLGVAPE